MVKNIFAFLIILSFIVACAIAKKDNGKHGSKATPTAWQEMDDFHFVMAETFHPFKDSANLQPVKERYNELVMAANAWVNSPIPGNVNTEKIKAKLTQLQAQASVLVENVKKGNDAETGISLTKLHDGFHEIQELWYGEGGK